MAVSDHIDTVRAFYGAGPSAEDTARELFAARDIVWHVPGQNRISGPYAGIEAVFRDMPASMQPLDAWDITVRDVMGNDDLVVATIHVSGRRYGRSIETDGAHVFRFDVDGRIAEAWGFTVDQSALDELLDPA
jgi:ketosteroid isomerase-like protein